MGEGVCQWVFVYPLHELTFRPQIRHLRLPADFPCVLQAVPGPPSSLPVPERCDFICLLDHPAVPELKDLWGIVVLQILHVRCAVQ